MAVWSGRSLSDYTTGCWSAMYITYIIIKVPPTQLSIYIDNWVGGTFISIYVIYIADQQPVDYTTFTNKSCIIISFEQNTKVKTKMR